MRQTTTAEVRHDEGKAMRLHHREADNMASAAHDTCSRPELFVKDRLKPDDGVGGPEIRGLSAR
jgi:hypothetical protein